MGPTGEPYLRHRHDLRDAAGQPACTRALPYVRPAQAKPRMPRRAAGVLVSLSYDPDPFSVTIEPVLQEESLRCRWVECFQYQIRLNPVKRLHSAIHPRCTESVCAACDALQKLDSHASLALARQMLQAFFRWLSDDCPGTDRRLGFSVCYLALKVSPDRVGRLSVTHNHADLRLAAAVCICRTIYLVNTCFQHALRSTIRDKSS